MKERIIRRLNEIIKEILVANDQELNKIGQELLDIEKQLIVYQPKRKD